MTCFLCADKSCKKRGVKELRKEAPSSTRGCPTRKDTPSRSSSAVSRLGTRKEGFPSRSMVEAHTGQGPDTI
jgi:hypothetical protein